MTTLNDFLVVDDLTDNLASYHNRLLGGVFRSEFSNAETLSSTRTLSDSDTAIQRFDCNGANRIVKMPTADTVDNHPFWIVNSTASGTWTLTVQNNAGTVEMIVLDVDDAVLVIPDGTGEYFVVNRTESAGIVPGGRLTLTSGTPVTTNDVSAATSVYYTPFSHNKIELWTGNYWKVVEFSELTLAIGTVTSGLPYDVFGYFSSGAMALEKLAWTNGTTRATAVTLQDGRYCKSGDKTRLYLGSFYSTSTTQTEDSAAKRFLFNMYNRMGRKLKLVDTTNSWTYSTATWRAWDNSNTNRVEVFLGIADDLVDVSFNGLGSNSAGFSFGFGLGLDSTSVNSADTYTSGGSSGAIVYGQARYTGYASVGYHYFQALEMGGASGTTTFYGDAGVAYLQAGVVGSLKC